MVADMKIKICGVTTLSDAKFVCASSVDYLGINKVESSPRFVDDKMAKSLIAVCLESGVIPVAVWQNPDFATVEKFRDKYPQCWLQFHGEETPAAIAKFDRTIKTITCLHDGSFNLDSQSYHQCEYLLIDAPKRGDTFDWKILNRLKGINELPLFLAGGITPSNVQSLLSHLDFLPYALDISSGIEYSPGLKSEKLLHKLQAQIKLAL